MKELFSFWMEALKHPSLYPFLDKGRGIEYRHRVYADSWQAHYKESQRFQDESLSSVSYDSIAIYGAGNLFDLSEKILTSGKDIYCYDADAIAARKVRKKFPHIHYVVEEITGTLECWKNELAKTLANSKNLDNLSTTIQQLSPKSPIVPPAVDVVLSLNLLGQIPLYWRDIVVDALIKAKIITTQCENLPKEIERALSESSKRLQELHLFQLQQREPKTIILITDENFRYYTAQNEFACERALFVSSPPTIAGYTPVRTAQWSWEVAPLTKTAPAAYGERHDIIATSYIKA